MTDSAGPSRGFLFDRSKLRSLVAIQWWVLFGPAAVNVLKHWRDSVSIRGLEVAWAVCVLVLVPFLFSARRELALRLTLVLMTLFVLAYLGACLHVGGFDIAAAAVLAYACLVSVLACWFFFKDGVLFGPA